MNPTLREILARSPSAEPVAVVGWVRTARHAKERSFLELTDGSCLAGLQLVAEPELANYASEVRRIATGTAISARGELRASPGAGQAFEVAASAIEVVGPLLEDEARVVHEGFWGT